MKRKHKPSLADVEKTLRDVKRAIVALQEMEARNGRVPVKCAALIAASHIPHIDACLKFLEQTKNSSGATP